jgi:hypothetical protein
MTGVQRSPPRLRSASRGRADPPLPPLVGQFPGDAAAASDGATLSPSPAAASGTTTNDNNNTALNQILLVLQSLQAANEERRAESASLRATVTQLQNAAQDARSATRLDEALRRGPLTPDVSPVPTSARPSLPATSSVVPKGLADLRYDRSAGSHDFFSRFAIVLSASQLDVDDNYARLLPLCMIDDAPAVRFVQAHAAAQPTESFEAFRAAFQAEFDTRNAEDCWITDVLELAMRPSEEPRAFVKRFMVVANRFAPEGRDERWLVRLLLSKLPSELRQFAERHLPPTETGSLRDVHRLLMEAPSAKMRPTPRLAPRPGPPSGDPKCYTCGQAGHTSRGCPVSKAPRVMRVEVDGAEETEVEEANAEDAELAFSQYASRVPLRAFPDASPCVTVPVLLEGHGVPALVDTGANRTVISLDLAERLGLTITSVDGSVHLAGGVRVERIGTVRPATMAHGRCVLTKPLIEVMALPSDYAPVILGMDHLSAVGITLAGLATAYPDELASTPSPLGAMAMTDVDDASPPTEWPQAVKAAMEANQALPPGTVCRLAEALVRLPTPAGSSAFTRQYKMSEADWLIVCEILQQFIDCGWIEPADENTTFNAPIMLVPKFDDEGREIGKRLVLDYRMLNLLLADDRHPLPLIDELLAAFGGMKVLGKLDLSNAFHCMPIDPVDRHKTAFTVRGRQWQWRVCPMGLKTAPAKFQRLVERVLAGAECTRAFVDDALLGAQTHAEFASRAAAAIERLTAAGLRINAKKVRLFASHLPVLGCVLSGDGMAVHPTRVARVAHWPEPSTTRQLQAALGAANYIRPHVQDLASLVAPLTALTSLPPRAFRAAWGPAHSAAFAALKKALASPAVLAHYDPTLPLRLATDASDTGLGSALFQGELNGSTFRLLGFRSRVLTAAERAYAATKREMLALVDALRHFRHMLAGVHFHVYTDHKALTFLHSQKEVSDHLARWWEFVSPFDFTLHHLPGVQNVLADHLSRVYAPRAEGDGPPDARASGPTLVPTVHSLDVPTAPSLDAEVSTGIATSAASRQTPQSGRPSDGRPRLPAPLSSAGGGRQAEAERALPAAAFDWVNESYGPFDVDAFAAHRNFKLRPYITRRANSLAQPWPARVYAFPPAAIVGPVVQKFLASRSSGVLLTPLAPAASWFGPLLRACGEPQRVPYANEILLAWRFAPPAEARVNHIARVSSFSEPPAADRPDLLREVHALGHFGVHAMYAALQDRGIHWPGMRDACQACVEACDVCAAAQIQRHGFHPARSLRAELPLDHLAMDLAGPLPTTVRGHNYIFVLVDVLTGYTWLRPLKTKSAEPCARILLDIFRDFGAPKIIQSDNGSEFSNAVMAQLTAVCNVEHRFCTPHHAQGNGLAERHVGTAKAILRKLAQDKLETWDDQLLWTQWAMNLKVRAKHGSTPFALMFSRAHNPAADYSATALADRKAGDRLVERINYAQDVVLPAVRARIDLRAAEERHRLDASRNIVSFPAGSSVMIKELASPGLSAAYTGPYTVSRVTRGGSYVLTDASGAELPRRYAPSHLKLRAVPSPHRASAVVDWRVDDAGVPEYKATFSDPTQAPRWMPAAELDPAVYRAFWLARLRAPLDKPPAGGG